MKNNINFKVICLFCNKDLDYKDAIPTQIEFKIKIKEGRYVPKIHGFVCPKCYLKLAYK